MFRRIYRIIRANLPFGNTYDFDIPTEDYTSQSYQRQEQQRAYNPPPPPPRNEETRHFEALELPHTATFAEIKVAYKKLVKKYHPDRFHNDPEKRQYAEVVTQRLNEAYAYFEKKYGAR